MLWVDIQSCYSPSSNCFCFAKDDAFLHSCSINTGSINTKYDNLCLHCLSVPCFKCDWESASSLFPCAFVYVWLCAFVLGLVLFLVGVHLFCVNSMINSSIHILFCFSLFITSCQLYNSYVYSSFTVTHACLAAYGLSLFTNAYMYIHPFYGF